MPAENTDEVDPQVMERRARDNELLAELTAPPSVEEARETYDFWRNRRATLPVYNRAERKEADQMASRWKERLAAAERERYGPSLLEQLFTALGVRRPPPRLPSRRKIIFGLSAIAVFVLVFVIALLVAIVVFWPDIQPIVRTLLNSNGNGGG
jgi:hypothetical protein